MFLALLLGHLTFAACQSFPGLKSKRNGKNYVAFKRNFILWVQCLNAACTVDLNQFQITKYRSFQSKETN